MCQTRDKNWSSSRVPGGWACLTAGSGRVSGSVVHVSKLWAGTRQRETEGVRVAIVDRTPGTGDQRPAVVRGRTIHRHRGQSAHLMSALTRL